MGEFFSHMFEFWEARMVDGELDFELWLVAQY